MNSRAGTSSAYLGRSPPMRHLNVLGLRRESDECHHRRDRFANSLLTAMRRGFVALLLVPWLGLAQSTPQKRVLILFDGAREFSNIEYLGQSLDSVLRPTLNQEVVVYREYMDVTRI